MKFLKSVILALLLGVGAANAATLHVGPTQLYRSVRLASGAASNGDSIIVDPGLYQNDVTSFYKSGLILKCYGPGRAVFDANGSIENNKGIWVVTTSATNFT